MVSSRDQRSSRFRLLDGSEVKEFINDEIEPDPTIDAKLLQETYGASPPYPSEAFSDLQTVDELEVLVGWYSKLAIGIL